jgi:hypothetical protein
MRKLLLEQAMVHKHLECDLYEDAYGTSYLSRMLNGWRRSFIAQYVSSPYLLSVQDALTKSQRMANLKSHLEA